MADVFLMYAEATNEVNGPMPDAIDLVNKIRRRANLPILDAAKTSSKQTFFDAIEQERIVELIGEGQRSFDIRRWRAIERIW
ncbi:RagB/SusD family nutrient uptake outer membrane protein, partial [Rhizobium leguminosarum]|uniref:RagB/SusD family nutrient uptake outer membrane protein n=1 Tax=Rhizobium leguminosarum TaxID=384 RepID=UPI003F9AEB6D